MPVAVKALPTVEVRFPVWGGCRALKRFSCPQDGRCAPPENMGFPERPLMAVRLLDPPGFRGATSCGKGFPFPARPSCRVARGKWNPKGVTEGTAAVAPQPVASARPRRLAGIVRNAMPPAGKSGIFAEPGRRHHRDFSPAGQGRNPRPPGHSPTPPPRTSKPSAEPLPVGGIPVLGLLRQFSFVFRRLFT